MRFPRAQDYNWSLLQVSESRKRRAAKTKAFYDRHGEVGIKHGVSDGHGGEKGGFYAMSRSALEVFEEFFGTDNPYAALMDLSSTFDSMTTVPAVPKGPEKVVKLGLTLEEAFFGSNRKISHTRKEVDEAGEIHESPRELTLHVRPGTRDGTRYIFEKEGNSRPGVEPGDLAVVVEHLEHGRFHAEGYDLVHRPKLALSQALAGCTLAVEMLDGRVLSIPVSEVALPGSRKVVEEEGMPDGKGGHGNLVIEYDVAFPRHLTEQQRTLIRAAFAFPAKPSKEQSKAFDQFRRAFEHHQKGWARLAR